MDDKYGDPEELIACPFDPVHVLRRKRMPYHILKCGKNFNRGDFKVCPFNSRHVVPTHQLRSHLDVCEDRGIVEREMQHKKQPEDNSQKGYTDLPPSTFVPPQATESWDDSNVVVDIAPKNGNGLFSEDRPSSQETAEPVPAPQVLPPPAPRKPISTGDGGSGVFALATRGRGRGRGIPSPIKIGVFPTCDRPGSKESPPKEAGVGRGRGALLQKMVARSIAEEEEAEKEEAEKKKKVKKLKKMLRQIVELEQKDVKTLNEDQLKKLSRKQDVMEMLLRLERE